MATTEIHRHEGGGSSAAPWVAFIAGIVLVAAIAAFFIFGGRGLESPTKTLDVEVTAPQLPDVKLPEAPRLPNG